jgi:hypothetical protein
MKKKSGCDKSLTDQRSGIIAATAETTASGTLPLRDEEFVRLENLEKDLRARVKNFSARDRLSRDELYRRR